MAAEVFDILKGGLCNVMQGLFREKSLMRSNDHIIKRKQTGQYIIVDNFIRLVFIEVFALLLVHVQTGRRDLLFLKAFDQVVGVDQLAPACIDDHYAFLHLVDGVFVDHIFCLVGQRTM